MTKFEARFNCWLSTDDHCPAGGGGCHNSFTMPFRVPQDLELHIYAKTEIDRADDKPSPPTKSLKITGFGYYQGSQTPLLCSFYRCYTTHESSEISGISGRKAFFSSLSKYVFPSYLPFLLSSKMATLRFF